MGANESTTYEERFGSKLKNILTKGEQQWDVRRKREKYLKVLQKRKIIGSSINGKIMKVNNGGVSQGRT